MRPALRAEWTKLRTVPGPRWLLLATIALTVALSTAVTSVMTCPSVGRCEDATRLALTGVDLGQAPIAILAVLVISGEYSTGMIQTTLTAMPRRAAVLAAKAVTLTVTVAGAGTVAVLGALLAGQLILPGHGYPAVTPADGPTLCATVGTILYLALIALLSLGIATIVRDSATSSAAVLALLYLFPLLAQTIGSPHWQRLLQQIGPMSAGLAIQATSDLPSLPIGPWAGLGVTAAWTLAALLTGGTLLYLRDP